MDMLLCYIFENGRVGASYSNNKVKEEKMETDFGKLLRINLSKQKTEVMAIPDAWYR